MPLFNEQDLIRKAEIFESRVVKSAPEILRASYKDYSPSDRYDIFLSHKFEDYDRLLLGVQREIKEMGYSVYVDWQDDPELDRSKVTRDTASRLKERMEQCRCLFYARTIGSSESVWMPWELGYFDGKKGKVAILPIAAKPSDDGYTRQEYLGLYPYVADGYVSGHQELGNTLWIHETASRYVRFAFWLEGLLPSLH